MQKIITDPTEPVHCLLVDDLEENLLALAALLRRDGVVLLKARSGRDALELLLEYDVALAMVDVQMPEMDGFELAELMRGTERTRRVPIIFLTAGSADRQRRFRGYEAGAVDFLQKPLEPDILRSKADVFFDLYRQRQEVARQRDDLRVATEENARLLEESRRYAEALKRADLRKDEFLAMLAHELRNPLSAISNAIQLFKQSNSPEHHDWARQVIETQIKNLSRLIDDLLDVSRITRGKIRLKKQIVDVRPIFGHAVTSVSALVQARGHELAVEYGHGETALEVDPTRLEQMVANLLNNAAKYSENGGRIRLRTEIRDATFIITVEDTGIGIEPERLPMIFELFAQEDCSLARSEGGLGIGLTLIKKLVELHGGSVKAESRGMGQGSTFTLSLPVAPSPPAAAVPQSGVKPEQTAVVKLRILLVDDNVDTVNAMARYLELKGQEVAIAHDGSSAVELAKNLRPDVVILDIGLPVMNGYEVVETIRRGGCCPDAYFIAITGYGQEQDRARFEGGGLHPPPGQAR